MDAAKKIILALWLVVMTVANASALAHVAPENRAWKNFGSTPETRLAEAAQPVQTHQENTGWAYENALGCCLAAKGAGQTTILGENMAQRVMPFAEQTGARTLGFGSTADEWAAMTAQQRYKLNDGMLRARINEGDSFRYIGQDPLRNPALRTQFDLTGSELLRLNSRGIPYETVSPSEVMSVLGRP